MEERVRIRIDEHGVADVCMVRADKMNALDAAMFDALNAAIVRLRGEPRLRAVVLHGEGRAFCAGLDVSRFEKISTVACANWGHARMAWPMRRSMWPGAGASCRCR